MEDKILTKWQLGMALQSKMDEGLSASEIGSRAFGFYFSGFEWDDDMLSDVILVLHGMETGPDFQYSEKELTSLAMLLINYDSLKDDKQFFLDNDTGFFFEYSSDRIKNDVEVVMTAVKSRGLSLEYASKNLRADKEIVLAAMKQNSLAFKYADEALKTDKDILLAKNRKIF
jgi:histidinol phosphatase-like PHP family hydrolase